MTGAQYIPWPQKCRSDTAVANQCFAMSTHRHIVAHHGGRLRHAEINHVANPGRLRGVQRHFCRHLIDAAKLRSFGGTGMRHADEMQAAWPAAAQTNDNTTPPAGGYITAFYK